MSHLEILSKLAEKAGRGNGPLTENSGYRGPDGWRHLVVADIACFPENSQQKMIEDAKSQYFAEYHQYLVEHPEWAEYFSKAGTPNESF